MGEGVRIDVSGIKDVTLEASRNAVTIAPLKGNELRDTPNYRDVRTDGSFTLNGRTVTIDPRRSGVRADGVKWIGSPLIEAGSAASQIGVGAAELMTKGGTVTFGVALLQNVDSLANTPQVRIAKSAAVDFSGGDLAGLGVDAVVTPVITASSGARIEITSARPLNAVRGYRALFDVVPNASTDPVELRLYLSCEGRALTETWLYQWLPPGVEERVLY